MPPLPEYAPPSHKTSMVLAFLRLLATILGISIKLVAIFILFFVALIATIVFHRR